MPCCLLNLDGRCTGHRQPTAKGVPVSVPGIALDLGFLQAWREPRAVVEVVFPPLALEDAALHPLARHLEGFDRRDRVCIQVNGASVSVFRLAQLDHSAIAMV